MKKKIISINEDLCIGCGNCITSCAEGALQMVNGKAKLVKEDFCDGLGNCIGDCPTDALKIIEKEISASDCGTMPCGCPSSMVIDNKERTQFTPFTGTSEKVSLQNQPSELRQWPVQLHLVNPTASYFKNSDLVVLSTCSPVASAQIHARFIKDNTVVVACPKLDKTEGYVEKLAQIFKTSNTPKVKVVIMQVPCCKGLSSIVLEAAKLSGRSDMVIEEHVVGLDGNMSDVKEIKY
ncbi:MAG: 4Fe-4S binding protein [Proteobacteria bacterium]|nr:4Fe-4S binding protein [Pseudomonadota bacterium]